MEELRKELANLQLVQRKTLISHDITGIQLGILSPEEIEKMSVIKVTSDNLSEQGGLYSPEFGTITNEQCPVCHGNKFNCLGHFGYISIYYPFLHPMFADIVPELLGLFCLECFEEREGKEYHPLLIPREELMKYQNLSNVQRFKAIRSIKDKGCPEHKCPTFSIEGPLLTVHISYEKGISIPMDLDIVEEHLRAMHSSDLSLLGIDVRPEFYIIKNIPVLPLRNRPPNVIAGRETPHDITEIYQRIITNNNLSKNSTDERVVFEARENVIKNFSILLDNKSGRCRKYNNQIYVTLKERIDGKDGIIRHNVRGKRGNFCVRAVVTPDPNIKINEIGIPKEIFNSLTTELKVYKGNFQYIIQQLKLGNIKRITRGEREFIINSDNKDTFIIKQGDIVHITLKEGDVVVFGRQPSLHRHNLMGAFVRALPGRTIRINPVIAAGMNCDYDG